MILIAETAWHHDGDFIFFKNLVEEIAAKTKTDFIKFHITLDVDEYMHTDHPAYQWARERIFSIDQWSEILEIPKKHNKRLMLLFNDKKAIDFGMTYQPELVEIHSVCLNDIALLNHLKDSLKAKTKVVLGVGGTEIYEVENAIRTIDTDRIVLMHGFQNYPTKYSDINFAKIKKLMQLYPKYEHGYADHTGFDNENNLLITLLGAGLGMDYIEKHVTTAYGQSRVDWQAAIGIDMFNELIDKLQVVTDAWGDGFLKLNKGEEDYSTFGVNKKAAILSRNVRKGDVLSENLFVFKRTGQNSDLSQLAVLNSRGMKFTADLPVGHCLVKQDLEKE